MHGIQNSFNSFGLVILLANIVFTKWFLFSPAAFRMFQALRELELPLNKISGSIRVDPSRDFHHLETLDLSYNRLTGDDILALGLLQNLKTLHLTGKSYTFEIIQSCIHLPV